MYLSFSEPEEQVKELKQKKFRKFFYQGDKYILNFRPFI